MEVILHLGAHKTATTFIQQTMQVNRDLLTGIGVFAPKLEDIRAALGGGLNGNNGMLDFDEALNLMLPDLENCRADTIPRIIFSDENIPGFPAEIFARGSFYLGARQRLQILKSWLRFSPETILYSVRPYDTFFPSAYAQWLGPYAKKHGPLKQYIPREEICEKIAGLKRGWPAVIRDIRATFPDSNIIITEYGQDRKYLQNTLQTLVGPVAPDMKYNAGFFWNRGLSAQLVELLEAQLKQGVASPESVAKIRASRGKNPSDLGQHFWQNDQQIALQSRYLADLDTIKDMANDKLIWTGTWNGATKAR